MNTSSVACQSYDAKPLSELDSTVIIHIDKFDFEQQQINNKSDVEYKH